MPRAGQKLARLTQLGTVMLKKKEKALLVAGAACGFT